jgi:hypothetical protein
MYLRLHSRLIMQYCEELEGSGSGSLTSETVPLSNVKAESECCPIIGNLV